MIWLITALYSLAIIGPVAGVMHGLLVTVPASRQYGQAVIQAQHDMLPNWLAQHDEFALEDLIAEIGNVSERVSPHPYFPPPSAKDALRDLALVGGGAVAGGVGSILSIWVPPAY